MTNIKIFIGVVILLIAGTLGTVLLRSNVAPISPSKLDGFAQCLKDKGAVFYGAFWCTHCQQQKKLFGSSAKLLPYVECSTADGRGQLQVCKDQKIEGYPTWKLVDGTQIPNENGAGVTLETLAAKTSCVLTE